MVCTILVVNAFLDAYEVLKNERYIQVARGSCEFILNDLNVIGQNEVIWFGNIVSLETQIHNANLLVASVLAGVYSLTREKNLPKFASKAVKFSLKYPNKDSSWY